MNWLKNLWQRVKPTIPEPTPVDPAAPQAGVFKWAIYVGKLAPWIVSVVLFVLYVLGKGPPAPVPGPPPIPPQEYAPVGGWLGDPKLIEENLKQFKPLEFKDTPAGQAVRGDEDVFLWRAVRQAAGQPDSWYPSVDQGPVGWCVGAGYKHSADVLMAVQQIQMGRGEWRPVSGEAIYGGSRVEVGGGRISGDGSLGSWAAKWVQDGGLLSMEVHGSHDLRQPSPSRAREWGRTGVPDELEPVSKRNPVRGVALCRSFQDVKRAIQSGYTVPVCSMQGFTMQRDRDGFCRPQGQWAHCMSIIGIRGGSRPGAFILNSWGDRAHTGPVWPADAPVAGFWADAATVDGMMRQNDSYVLSDAAGFPARKLDWFVHARPADQPILNFADLLALAK